ncbi:MAG: hypothetical protein Q7S01_04440 [bacterium]|nr:hypothetical protein [bacterium]
MRQKSLGMKLALIAGIVMFVGVSGYLIVKQFVPTRMIIVGIKIDPPFQVAGNLSSEKEKAQEAAIIAATDIVLGDLRKNLYGYVGLKRYKYIPFFAITVSENGYQYLLKHPLVTSVEKDLVASATSHVIVPSTTRKP